MGFNCGIVGLPNVGKSTIFNALTANEVDASNYPFCTIEPNTGVVAVPDARLAKLSAITKSKETIPTTVEFVDIAGLVRGASKGEGLGNQFLGHIRAVDAIIHVVRCFEDENITHVDGSVDPIRDIEVIETELLLSDMASVEKRLEKVQKTARSGDKEAVKEKSWLESIKSALDEGIPAKNVEFDDDEQPYLQLLTAKPILYVANVSEDEAADYSGNTFVSALKEVSAKKGSEVVVISGKLESEIALLDDDEKNVFLEELGLSESGLDRLATAGYSLLNLLTFFTSGEKETRAWTCKHGSIAPEAAGVIHTDFIKGFIRAEVISYQYFIEFSGEQGAKEHGKQRIEGKDYLMQDGDVVHFRVNG